MKTSRSQPQTVTVNSLSHDGRGIANLNGKTTFIHGALPDEQVICKLTKQHSRFNEAFVQDVILPSADRVNPLCEHFSICGGCSLQHLDITRQVGVKQKILLEQLVHFGKVVPETVLPAITGNPWHYRRKARLGVRYVRKKGKVLVGFREKSTNFLTDIRTCSILHKSVGQKILELQGLIESLSQYDQIPQIEVAIGDAETALIFRNLEPLSELDICKLQAFAKENQFTIYLQPGSPDSLQKLWPNTSSNLLSYTLTVEERLLKMQFHPLDFIQVNGEINQLMVHQALNLLELQSEDVVLDLFCGLGNFTLPIALYAKEVIGVEGSATMVNRATFNADFNRIKNTKFYTANLMEPLLNAPWLQTHYHKILLDPPRTGAKEVIPPISVLSPQKICYVSCNPSTLARDAGELVHTYGYRLSKVGVVNMFPHTSHVEAMALFEK